MPEDFISEICEGKTSYTINQVADYVVMAEVDDPIGILEETLSDIRTETLKRLSDTARDNSIIPGFLMNASSDVGKQIVDILSDFNKEYVTLKISSAQGFEHI